MDTRFWGPSGWKLLHTISYTVLHTPPIHQEVYANFFETLPYILPCKYCRSSLTDYYRRHPFSPSKDIGKWMYMLHNCVNDKLRKQGLYPSPNPSYGPVKRLYDTLLQAPWDQQLTGYWDFLFSVGYHHPKEKHLYSSPMPECPPTAKHSTDACERNKWNILPMRERIRWFRRFWELLPAVLPPSIRPHWLAAEKHHPPTLSSRRATLAWLWRMRCELETGFHDPYTSVCKRIANYSSDCPTQKGVFTCRRSTSRKNHKPRISSSAKKTLKRK